MQSVRKVYSEGLMTPMPPRLSRLGFRGWVVTAAAGVVIASAAGGAAGAVYKVGPGRGHETIGDVPWEALAAGDRVLIHARPAPYREKWVICRRGTADAPIVISGVPDADGNLPVIDGSNAVTRAA